MYFQFANVLVFFVFTFLMVAALLGLASLLRPANPEPLKLTSYECGEPPTGGAWMNFNIRFYLVALIFVIFDVEIAFIYPVAAVFKEWVNNGRGGFALAEIAIFLCILFVGLAYVWAKGDLAWLKRVRTSGEAGSRAIGPAGPLASFDSAQDRVGSLQTASDKT